MILFQNICFINVTRFSIFNLQVVCRTIFLIVRRLWSSINYNNLHWNFLLLVPVAGQAGWDPLSRAPSSSSAQTSSGSPLLLPSIFWHPMTFRLPKHLTTWTGFSTGFDEEDELVSTFCSDSGSTLSSPLAIMASGVAPLTYLAGQVDPSTPNALLDLQRFTKQNTHSTYEQYTLFSSWNTRCFTTCFTPFWEWFSTQLGRRSFFIATPLVVFPSSTTNKWFQAFPTSPSSFSRSSLFRSFVVFTSTFLTGDSNCCLPEKPMISEKDQHTVTPALPGLSTSAPCTSTSTQSTIATLTSNHLLGWACIPLRFSTF